MVRSKAFRVVLVLVFLGGAAAVLWSYLSRSGLRSDDLSVALLSGNITRQSTEFEHTELKGGKLLFRVQAGTSTLDSEGVHVLEDVNMFRYGVDREPEDQVEGKGAVYKTEEKEIEFREDVVIHLSDGTSIFADSAGADLATELVQIKDAFKFAQGDTEGVGRALLYSIPDETLAIRDGFSVEFQTTAGPISCSAKTADYALNDREFKLIGDAKLSDGLSILSAEEIVVTLDEVRRVTDITSIGKARLAVGSEKEFRGEKILLLAQRESEGTRVLRVLGGDPEVEVSSTPILASYRETGESGEHFMEAARIEAELFSGLDSPGAIVLRELTGNENVELTSTSLRIQDSQADQFVAQFSATSGLVEKLRLTGQVRVVRCPDSSRPGCNEVLRGDELTLLIDGEQSLTGAEVVGNVEIEMNSDEGFRELRASDALRLYYSEGALDRVVGERDCVLNSTEPALKHSVRAPNVEAFFAEGHLNRILAMGGVDVEIVDEDGVRHTRSSELTMDYEAGLLSRAVQEGGFRLWKNSKEGTLELTSEKASYDPKKKTMEASGGKPRLKSSQNSSTGNAIRSETSARNFFLSREDLGVVAKGEVRSVFDIGDGSVVVTSGEMEADLDSGWASYSVEPRVVRGPNLFTANTIRVKSDRREMTGEGNVESLLVEGDGPEDRKYRITSNQMQFLGNENRALYQGEVELKSDDLTLNAPELELFFTDSSGSQFDRVEASGGVVVVEGERRWTGKSAVYYRADERVLVRNN